MNEEMTEETDMNKASAMAPESKPQPAAPVQPPPISPEPDAQESAPPTIHEEQLLPSTQNPATLPKNQRSSKRPILFSLDNHVAPEEEILQEEEVFGDVVGYGFSDAEMKRYFRSPEWAAGWQKEQAPAPLLTPEQEQEKSTYWKDVLKGDISLIPNNIREQILGDTEDESEEEQDYQLHAAVNRSWSADYLGLSRESIQASWPMHRARLAKRLEVADTDEDVYLALSLRESEKPLREAGEKVYNIAYAAGIEGHSKYDIEAYLKGLSLAQIENARGLAVKAYDEGKQKRMEVRPLARVIKEGIEAFKEAESSALPAIEVLQRTPALVKAVQELSQMTRAERNTVLHVTRSLFPPRRPDSDSNIATTMLHSVRRSALNSGMDLAQGLLQLGGVELRRWGKGESQDDSVPRQWADTLDKYSIVFEELRRLAHDELYPLNPPQSSGLGGQFLVDMSNAVPEIVLSFLRNPIVGALTDVRDVGKSTMDVRQRAPEASADVALTAGALGLLIQRQVENTISKIGGEKVSKAVTRLIRNRGGGIKRYVVHGAGIANAAACELVRELVADKMGEGAGLLTQETLMKCRQTASNIDWEQFGSSILDVNMNIRAAAAELPFILLGAGRVALRDFTSPGSLLKNDGEALKQWGIPDEQRLQIVEEKDIDKKSELLRQALSHSPKWAGMGFWKNAAKALRLLNFERFQGFNDESFVCDFLQIPPRPEREDATPHPATDKDVKIPPLQPGVYGLGSMLGAGKEYVQQVTELWKDIWKKTYYSDDAKHLPLPPWIRGKIDTPTRRRLALYVEEGNRAPYRSVPMQLLREGLYAPYADMQRNVLIRDRVEDINSISHLYSLHSVTVDSMSEQKIPIEKIRARAEEARQEYLGNVIGSLLRIAQGENREQVFQDAERKILHYFRDRLFNMPHPPLWLLSLSQSDFERMPEYQKRGQYHYSWLHWLKTPELLEMYRICAGTRSNIGMMADLLPLTNDYYTALSRGMTPLQAFNHLLLRELPCDTKKIPHYPANAKLDSEVAVRAKQLYKENKRLFDLREKMFGRVVNYVDPDGMQSLWQAELPDGSFSRCHTTPYQAINDYMMHVHTYFTPFNTHFFLPEGFELKGRRKLDPNGSTWFVRRNKYLGHDQLFSYASRDMVRYWNERAHLLQPGLDVDRSRRYFYLGNDEKNDGVTPLFPTVDMRRGLYGMDHMSNLSPIAMMQSRFRVFWERMMLSGRVAPQFLKSFIEYQEQQYPELKELSETLFYDLNEKSNPTWAKSMRSKLSNKMAIYSTCYIVANPDSVPLPRSVRTWLKLTPFCPLAHVEKPRYEWQIEEHRSVPRGVDDAALMMWANRKSAEKLRRIAPLLEKLRDEPFSPQIVSKTMQKLFDLSTGMDKVQQVENAWTYLLCGEEIFRNSNQVWLNFLQNPLEGWDALSPLDRKRLGDYMAPWICKDNEISDAGSEPDYYSFESHNETQLLNTIREISPLLQSAPALRKICWLDEDQPYVSTLFIDNSDPGMKFEDEPLNRVLSLYRGGRISGCSVMPFGQFTMEGHDAAEKKRAIQIMSLMRKFPMVKPHVKNDTIYWKGEEYGGLHGKAPRHIGNWEIIENPLESLLMMRDRVEQLEQANMQDAMIYFPYLHNNVTPVTHHKVYGNVTAYRHPRQILNQCRLMPGEPQSIHYRVADPYVVQSSSGSYLWRKVLAGDKTLMEQSMQPLDEFRPGWHMNRGEYLQEYGRTAAIRQNLNLVMDYPLEFNVKRTSLNVSPREMFMRLAFDSGFLNTLNNARPYQLDYGTALTYKLINSLYEFSCHPEESEVCSELRKIIYQLKENQDEYQLVFQVLREAGRSKTPPSPIMTLFDWKDEIGPYVEAARLRREAEAVPKLPGVRMVSIHDMRHMIEEEKAVMEEPDLPPLELFQYDFRVPGEEGDIKRPLFNRSSHDEKGEGEWDTSDDNKILLTPKEQENESIWGDLFRKYMHDKDENPSLQGTSSSWQQPESDGSVASQGETPSSSLQEGAEDLEH